VEVFAALFMPPPVPNSRGHVRALAPAHPEMREFEFCDRSHIRVLQSKRPGGLRGGGD